MRNGLDKDGVSAGACFKFQFWFWYVDSGSVLGNAELEGEDFEGLNPKEKHQKINSSRFYADFMLEF